MNTNDIFLIVTQIDSGLKGTGVTQAFLDEVSYVIIIRKYGLWVVHASKCANEKNWYGNI